MLAGYIYWICNLVATILMINYLIGQFSIVVWRDPGHHVINYIAPALWILSSCAGFATWWWISEVEWSNDCEDDDFKSDEKVELCPQNGVYVGIIACTFTVTTGVYAIVANIL
jgi:hypothetical protein